MEHSVYILYILHLSRMGSALTLSPCGDELNVYRPGTRGHTNLANIKYLLGRSIPQTGGANCMHTHTSWANAFGT